MHVLVTGASGFVGRRFITEALEKNYTTRISLLDNESKRVLASDVCLQKCQFFVVGDISNNIDWLEVLKDIDVVVHLAARVHIMNDSEPDPLAAFRSVNVEGTKRLIESAIANKVKRFIFMSSLHVNVSVSSYTPFKEEDKPNPLSPYAVSKWEAEQYLNDVAKKTDMEIVIIRPPLVYGPRVKANFLSLLKLTKTGLPLPVSSLKGKRSMVSVNNLVDFIICCVEHPKAANETFLISDDSDISTRELFTKLIKLFGKKHLLLPIPTKILYILGALLGEREIVDRLCSPLQVNITKAKTLLNWKPIQTLDNGLKETVEWYKKECL